MNNYNYSFETITLEKAIKLFNLLKPNIPSSLSPQYIDTYCKFQLSNSTTINWLYREKEKFLIYSFIKTKINEDLFDIQSAYGYSCPLTNQKDLLFIERSQNSFSEWAKENNILVEFIRFHPLLESNIKNCWCKNFGKLTNNRPTIYIDLGQSNILSGFRDSHRRKVKKFFRDFKAKIQSPEKIISSDINLFYDIYTNHMKAINASKNYFFSYEYINRLIRISDSRIFFLEVNDKRCASIVIQENKSCIAEYFLGCTDKNQNIPKNSLLMLLYLIAEYYKKRNYKKFYLGGGRSPKEDDTLLFFKKGFSSESIPFFIGGNVYEEKKYHALKEIYPNSDTNRIIFYRDNL